jgi:hypothetical protein
MNDVAMNNVVMLPHNPQATLRRQRRTAICRAEGGPNLLKFCAGRAVSLEIPNSSFGDCVMMTWLIF